MQRTIPHLIAAAGVLAGCLIAAPSIAEPPAYDAVQRAWSIALPDAAIGTPAEIAGPQGAKALLVTTGDGRVLVVSPAGRITTSMRMDFHADFAAVAGTIDRSGEPRIVCADARGAAYAFDLRGRRLWKVANDTRASGFRVTVLADLYGDGLKEALIADVRGGLRVVDGQGRIRLDVVGGRYRVCPPAVGDVDGDGKAEIIFGTDEGDMTCIDAYGRVRWSQRLEGRLGRSLPLIADPDGTGRHQVYVTRSFVGTRLGMYALDARTGRRLWKGPAEAQSYQSTIAADIDGDGRLEVLFGDKSSYLYCLDGRGRKKWTSRIDGRGVFFSAAVADLPGAGGVLFFATANGSRSLHVLGARGQSLGMLSDATVDTSPLLCRFAGRSRLNLVACGAQKRLICWTLPATTGTPRILWAGPRSDASHTGFVRSKAAVRGARAQAAASGAPASVPMRLGTNHLRLTPPAGARRIAVQVAQAGSTTRTRISLLAGRAACDVPVVVERAGRVEASVDWLGASGTPFRSQRFTATVDGRSAADAADTRRLVADLLAPGRTAPAFEVRAALAAAAPGLLERARLLGTVQGYDEARWTRESWASLARVLAGGKAAGGVLVQPIGNPWANFDARTHLASARAGARSLRFTMPGNAYHSAAIAVTNLQPRPVTLRFETGTFQRASEKPGVPGDQVVQVRECPLVRLSTSGAIAEDPLPLLGEAQTVRLGLGETRKIWLTFHSAALAAGTYRAEFRLGDPAYQTATQRVPVTLEVLPVRLPQKRAFRHGNWLYLAGYPDVRMRDMVMEDALAHGTNLFNIPGVTVNVDAEGRITGASSELPDTLVRQLHPRGAFFMVNGSVGVNWPADAHPDEATRDRVWAEALRWYVRHMRDLGVPPADYALYLMDEPGLHGNDTQFREWAANVRKVKAAAPDIQVYSNPAGTATPDMLRPLADLVSAWQPDLHLVKADIPAYREVFSKAPNYWHYEAPGDQRNIDPLGFYRIQPWVSYRYGMNGGGYWVYGSPDYWLTDPIDLQEYGAVYLGPTGPVSTRRWEATREGIQDFELLWMLRERARNAGDRGRAALRLIDEAVAYVTRGQDDVSDISRQVEPICPEFDRWMGYRDRILRALTDLGPAQ